MKKIIYTSNYFLYALLISAVFFIAVILLFSLNTQPYIRIQTVYAEDATFSGGSGTELDPYIINNPDDLIKLSELVNNGTKRTTDEKMYSALYYKLGKDIDMSGKEFIPIGKEGVSEEELEQAKSYLISSYNLRFASLPNIAETLVAMQEENLGSDFLIKRNQYIQDVTLEQVNNAARKYFDANRLIWVNFNSTKQN